jgi:hypothetical protein
MPLAAWRLLRILLGDAAPEEIIREAEERVALNPKRGRGGKSRAALDVPAEAPHA